MPVATRRSQHKRDSHAPSLPPPPSLGSRLNKLASIHSRAASRLTSAMERTAQGGTKKGRAMRVSVSDQIDYLGLSAKSVFACSFTLR